jgi:hypothetical protein
VSAYECSNSLLLTRPCGYDYCCTFHPLDIIVKSCVCCEAQTHGTSSCVTNDWEGKGQATKKDKLALFGSRKAPVILFDTTSALVLDLIIRYLCPFAITDGLGFAKNAWPNAG